MVSLSNWTLILLWRKNEAGNGCVIEIRVIHGQENNRRAAAEREAMKKRTISIWLMVAGCLFVTVALSGCTTWRRNNALEKVAKDWSMVIRASQVIPVYPLTEDLQPGDVLLVSTPLGREARLYKKKGFLPLDQHMVRLHPEGYDAFYLSGTYGVESNSILPKLWREDTAWTNAPIAGFPSYSFSVTTKSGFQLALPVQGVPVAMGLMNTGEAKGSVAIKDAHTYGIDILTLQNQVRKWADEHKSFLQNYEPDKKRLWFNRFHYLRVVSRVYLTQEVGVSIQNTSSTTGDASVAQRFDVLASENIEEYKKKVKGLSSVGGSIGGSLAFNVVSSRTINMKETFDSPIVIGYIAFDMPILKGGNLGFPVSTLSRLKKNAKSDPEKSEKNLSKISDSRNRKEKRWKRERFKED